jgi:hypothetical protein
MFLKLSLPYETDEHIMYLGIHSKLMRSEDIHFTITYILKFQ